MNRHYPNPMYLGGAIKRHRAVRLAMYVVLTLAAIMVVLLAAGRFNAKDHQIPLSKSMLRTSLSIHAAERGWK